MPFDYKKEYKVLYLPPKHPVIIEVPKMNFVAVRGKGNPNEDSGEYNAALNLLYGISYTLKMSHKGTYAINGFFEYVVPPLEGFWWHGGADGIDFSRKDQFQWISLIRLPDFVTKTDFEWAITEATKKKNMDFSAVQFFTYDEGCCVQCMHIGSYDNEPATILAMKEFAEKSGYKVDITENRYHHEIYLNDPRKTDSSKLKTVIRHPIKKAEYKPA